MQERDLLGDKVMPKAMLGVQGHLYPQLREQQVIS